MVAQGEASPAHLTYLEDRVRVHAGQPQLFGTLFTVTSGNVGPYRIEDPQRLDERRAAAFALGLEIPVSGLGMVTQPARRHLSSAADAQIHPSGRDIAGQAETATVVQIGGYTRFRRTEGLLRSVTGAVVQGARRRENPSLTRL